MKPHLILADKLREVIEMKKIVSEEEKRIWAERYLKGETARSIWKDYQQYSESTISRNIKKMGISRGKGINPYHESIKEQVISEYLIDKKSTFVSLGKKYNISDRTVSSWIQERGIKRKQPSGKISSCNEDYFENIDNPNKAYLLGFITADGAVTGKKNYAPNTCSIEVKDSDIDILLFAKQEINPKAKIIDCYYNKKTNKKISFSSKKLCDDLKKYGIVKNKSKIIKEVPINLIPKNLLPFYFRGLIDGDGCIHKNGAISIYSGSKDFIISIQKILCEEANVKQLGIYKGTSYFISWSSKTDKEKLYNYLYKNKLDKAYYYKRKYNRLFNSLYDNTVVSN